jgi:UDPglucose 6-dehydrogenase
MQMNLVNAELAKLAVNTFVTTKISYANMLAEICEQLPGADAAVVTAAVGLDSRIGNKYLQPATPYGGPCFPRDNAALVATARQVHVIADLAEATDAVNTRQLVRLADLVCGRLPAEGRAAILGLAYKPGTVVADASTGIRLASELRRRGVRTAVYDPAATPSAERLLGEGIVYASSAKECVHGADVVVLATAWEAFKELDAADFVRDGQRPVIVDCWRVLDPERFSKAAEVVHIGQSYAGDEGQEHV